MLPIQARVHVPSSPAPGLHGWQWVELLVLLGFGFVRVKFIPRAEEPFPGVLEAPGAWWHSGSGRAEARQSLWLWRDLQCQDPAALCEGTCVVGCWTTTHAAVTFWVHQRQQKDPCGLQWRLHLVLFCVEGSTGVGESACGKLLHPGRSWGAGSPCCVCAVGAAVCCLLDAEISCLGGPSPAVATPQQGVGTQSNQRTLYRKV